MSISSYDERAVIDFDENVFFSFSRNFSVVCSHARKSYWENCKMTYLKYRLDPICNRKMDKCETFAVVLL